MPMKYTTFYMGLICSVFVLPSYAQNTVVGKIGFAKGNSAAQQTNEAPRILAKDAPVYQGDNIQTSDASFVIVDFTDGSKINVRPNSNFKIDTFDTSTKNAKFTVYEGAVRASTGDIATTGQDNFQIKTPTTTLKGDKDSDYTVYVCKEQCNNAKKTPDISVAKVVDIKGDVYAQNRANKNEGERKLSLGANLNAQDYLTSQADSYVVMVFRDGEKVTLQANSEFDIVQYDYQQTGKKDKILFKLAAGGMRALTGSIGKKDHDAYAVNTPVATIGIRGTEYDLQCNGSCIEESNIENNGLIDDDTSGMISYVQQGTIAQTNASGEHLVNQGQISFINNLNAQPIQLAQIPVQLIEKMNSAPRPSTAPNPEKLFDKSAESTKAGTYATVNKGSAKLEMNEKTSSLDQEKSLKGTKLSSGESSFSGESSDSVAKLEETPHVIAQDNENVASDIKAAQNSGANCAVQ
jgi:hypothetical protein